MSLYSSIRSELVKLKHTSFWAIHIVIPILGAVLFVFYFLQYGNINDDKKFKLLMELTVMAFPLLISIIAGLNILQEERASYFQNVLAVSNRNKRFLSKLIVLYGAGAVSLSALTAFFVLGMSFAGKAETIQIGLLVKAVSGIAVGNLIIYILHLFLGFKFGIGISLFWGVFETLQCIIYSNIELHGAARFIPFSWAVNLMHDVLDGSGNITELAVILLLTAVELILTLIWFHNWEGRKNYE